MKPNLPKVKRILKKANPGSELKVSWDKKPYIRTRASMAWDNPFSFSCINFKERPSLR
jgi:hypothetical protein